MEEQEQQQQQQQERQQEQEQTSPTLFDLPFRFLDLPPELRNEVYSYAMPGTNNLRSRDLATLQFPAITRASRQLRHESLGFLFSECHFVICVGTNWHHRSWSTSAYALKPCRWDPVSDCGTLGFRPAVRRFLKTAGKAALFRDVTFNVYHPSDVHFVRYRGHERAKRSGPAAKPAREEKMEGNVHLKIGRDGTLEVVVAPSSRTPAVAYDYVERAKEDAKKAAEEVGKREGFKGLTMSDLHQIAKSFYWKPEG